MGKKMAVDLKVKEKDYNLDPFLWRLVEVDGYPVAALYFNGREFSLSQDAMEDLTKIISEYIQDEQDARANTTPELEPIQTLWEYINGPT
jgi:hypothetical protein